MPDDAAYPVAKSGGNGDESKRARQEKAKVWKGKVDREESVGGMARKEMEWAIGVTEERLRVLKEAIVGEADGEKGREREYLDKGKDRDNS